MSSPSQPDSRHPKRRPRYRGTHPRRFEQRYKELRAEQYPDIVPHVRAQGRTPAGMHVPIMVEEVMAALGVRAGDVVADCTIGYGGHAEAFLARIGPAGRLIGFDVDGAQLDRTRGRLADARVHLHRSNFAGIAKALTVEGLDGYDVIFADLGVSSMQIDDPARGFSYKHDGPLDMRMDDRLTRTAADWLGETSGEEIATALRELSDEEDAEAVATMIVRARAKRPIVRTLELVEIVMLAKGGHVRRPREANSEEGDQKRLHPAAKTFQTLRILVNDELGSLRHLLRIAPGCLLPGGRIGLLSFHSGEDRLVKQAFRDGVRSGAYAQACDDPLRPSQEEVHDNPRSRPAKLRWARRHQDSDPSSPLGK